MTTRVLPQAEKFASCPSDGKILDFYKGQFDDVFVLLHPFVRPMDISIDRFCPEHWPTKLEILEHCEPVVWQRILEMTELTCLEQIDVGLRTSIHGLNGEKANELFASSLIELSETTNIIHPTEGQLPPLLENRIFNTIKLLGYEWLWVGDDLGTERKLHWIDDLMSSDEVPSHGCIFTPDHRLLITTHWDSHCSFLCSSKDLIEKILDVDNFEGFYCTENTEVYWGLYER
ncbi:DUF2711 family protein [Undibacterium seohonense]|uniref:DUF2711 family protein n=1 Tax=Undibacterium seohonense TaxID=1344950 RepID=A0ABR6X7T3_9BURK|nr:DUF2711 family protein [Undibacterium seohonense]MBC3808379.1 DUF2711 family protein [Undibacterium seohonense]